MTDLLRAPDVAKRLGVTPMTVYNLTKGGVIRAVVFKAGGNRWTYRFRAEDVESFISGHLREGKGETR